MIAKDSRLVKTLQLAASFFTYECFRLMLIIVVRRLEPETRGRALEEIERRWNGQRSGTIDRHSRAFSNGAGEFAFPIPEWYV